MYSNLIQLDLTLGNLFIHMIFMYSLHMLWNTILKAQKVYIQQSTYLMDNFILLELKFTCKMFFDCNHGIYYPKKILE